MVTLSTETPHTTRGNPLGQAIAIFPYSMQPSSALYEALEQAHYPGSPAGQNIISIENRTDAQQFLQHNADGLLIVLLAHPARELAIALQAEVPINEAVHMCSARIASILSLINTDRRRTLLIDHIDSAERPIALSLALKKYKGIHIPVPSPLGERHEGPSDAYYALSLLCLIEHPEVSRWYGELEAHFLPLDPSANVAAPVWKRGLNELTRLQGLAKQNETLAAEHGAIQRDFEVVARAEATLSKRNVALLREVSTLESERRQSRRGLEKLKVRQSTNNKELSSLTSKVNYLRKRKDAAEQRALLLEQRLTLMRASTSWRITSPIRAAKAILRRLTTGKQ